MCHCVACVVLLYHMLCHYYHVSLYHMLCLCITYVVPLYHMCHCITYATVSHVLCIVSYVVPLYHMCHRITCCATVSHTAQPTPAVLPRYTNWTTKWPIGTAPTGWTVRNSIPGTSRKHFSSPNRPYWLSGPPSPDAMGTGSKRSGREADHSARVPRYRTIGNIDASAALDYVCICLIVLFCVVVVKYTFTHKQ
jgi:hypothetical protein